MKPPKKTFKENMKMKHSAMSRMKPVHTKKMHQNQRLHGERIM